MFLIVSGLIGVALLFDYINGFHDAANSIATVVSTRVLSPGKAVIWAAFFNFVAAFVFGTAVSQTVGSGMIDGVLYAAHYIDSFHIPFWVVLIAHTAIGLGTLAGGWRIIHTMGSKITKLQPVGGFAAETGAALALMTATLIGVPVSTTHAITGAIVRAGSTRRLSAVRWGVAGQIVWAWVPTIPSPFTSAAMT